MNNTQMESDGNNIQIGQSYFLNQSNAAKTAMQNAVVEYAERLRREAESIERGEHIGDGPPQITGAHIEEAKFVSLRRMRRNSLSIKKTVLLRIGQLGTFAVIGIGASNFNEL